MIARIPSACMLGVVELGGSSGPYGNESALPGPVFLRHFLTWVLSLKAAEIIDFVPFFFILGSFVCICNIVVVELK